MWMLWPEVLANYAMHHETGGRCRSGDRGRAARAPQQFNEGFATSEYLGAALLDQAWHRLGADAAKKVGCRDVRGRGAESGRTRQSGRSAPLLAARTSRTSSRAATTPGYYSYIWSEVLDADTVDWFKENGGLTRANGDRFRSAVARRRRLEGPARGLRRLPRAPRRDRAAAQASRARVAPARRSRARALRTRERADLTVGARWVAASADRPRSWMARSRGIDLVRGQPHRTTRHPAPVGDPRPFSSMTISARTGHRSHSARQILPRPSNSPIRPRSRA